MSKIVKTTVRIIWRREIPPDGIMLIRYETLDEFHTAPPPDVWKARKENT